MTASSSASSSASRSSVADDARPGAAPRRARRARSLRPAGRRPVRGWVRWAVLGGAAAAVLLGGCGEEPTGPPPPPVTLSATLADGEVTVDEASPEVPRGTEVTLQVTSDEPVEVHVHGFDEYIRISEAGTDEATFTVDLPGVFEIETHETGLLIYQLTVR
ncbi:hypothetical protein [Aquipuribacter hungaricus]|uniref:EfeO-type cupredoxin-like domain-containing protein n=1 Tax=Aquipuribacter hungaricus TaxID=545624 RepID=A0ABV7WMX4_9MICO